MSKRRGVGWGERGNAANAQRGAPLMPWKWLKCISLPVTQLNSNPSGAGSRTS